MSETNYVRLTGNLGKDPAMRQTTTGKAVGSFSLATTREYTANGIIQKKTDWHNVVVWGKLASSVGLQVKKGDRVTVEGRIETRKYTDKAGAEKWITEVVASNLTKAIGSLEETTPTQPEEEDAFL